MKGKRALSIFPVILVLGLVDSVISGLQAGSPKLANDTKLTVGSCVQSGPASQEMVSVPWDTTSEHGTMVFIYLEGGCWLFIADCGDTVEPKNGPPWMYYHDIEGTMTAVYRHDWGSICNTGDVVDVIWFSPDPFRVHGTVHRVPAEWNCWQFEADNGRLYEPIGGPSLMYSDGQRGTMTVYPRREMGSTCQAGEIVQVLAFDPDR